MFFLLKIANAYISFLCTMLVDYIIVGQGLSGSLLGLELVKMGCKILVVDDNYLSSASRVAGGIINPVTGKRLVRSWMIEQLLPFALDTYNELSAEWEVALIQQSDILDFHYDHETEEAFTAKLVSESEYLRTAVHAEEWIKYFRFNYGVGVVSPCYLLDIKTLLKKCRERLKAHGALVEEKFRMDRCEVHTDKVIYRSVTAKKIIFCEGAAGADNPYFDKLPWSKDKGEALIVSIPGLPRTNIFKQGISIIPWEKDLFWVGAAHDRKYTDLRPTDAFRKKVEEQLDYWLKIPYNIVDHLATQRPANIDRRPFVGLHPGHSAVGILNGMGGKGCSVAPYFAHQLAAYLVHQNPINPEADVKRYQRMLSR